MSPCIPLRSCPSSPSWPGSPSPSPLRPRPSSLSPPGRQYLTSLPASFWSWAARLWSGVLQKHGGMIDPDG